MSTSDETYAKLHEMIDAGVTVQLRKIHGAIECTVFTLGHFADHQHHAGETIVEAVSRAHRAWRRPAPGREGAE